MNYVLNPDRTDEITYLAMWFIMNNRSLQYSQPAGRVWVAGVPVDRVEVTLNLVLAEPTALDIGRENGLIMAPLMLFGCPVKTASESEMNGLLFVLINPDGLNGVGLRTDYSMIKVMLKEGVYTPIDQKEESHE